MAKSKSLTDRPSSSKAAGIADLRRTFKELLACKPPPAFGLDLLKLSIAYETQRRKHGGLSRSSQRELQRLAQRNRTAGGSAKPVQRVGKNATLFREWNGQQHRVRTVDGGFDYNGKIYGNLSQIARLITGTRWNGPRFFGLREPASTSK